MKKIKLFLCVALFGAMSFGAYTAYEHYNKSEEERFFLANIEALTLEESGGVEHPGCKGVIPPEKCVDDNGKLWNHAERE